MQHDMVYLNNEIVSTQVCTLDDFKESFCQIDLFKERWECIEKLMKSSFFKTIMPNANHNESS